MSFTPPGGDPEGSASVPPPAPPVPGWWQASDGNWYPPYATPGAGPPPMSPAGAPPGMAYGAPPQPAGYGYTPYAGPQRTNGLAIASMVLGILWLEWVGSILAIIFGFVALSQIKTRNQSGRGMAIAGLILGFVEVGVFVLVVVVIAATGG